MAATAFSQPPVFEPLPPPPTRRQYHELLFELVPLEDNPYPHGVAFRVSACLVRSNFKARKQTPVIIVFVQHHEAGGAPETDFETAVATDAIRTRQPAYIPCGSTGDAVRHAMARVQAQIGAIYGLG